MKELPLEGDSYFSRRDIVTDRHVGVLGERFPINKTNFLDIDLSSYPFDVGEPIIYKQDALEVEGLGVGFISVLREETSEIILDFEIPSGAPRLKGEYYLDIQNPRDHFLISPYQVVVGMRVDTVDFQSDDAFENEIGVFMVYNHEKIYRGSINYDSVSLRHDEYEFVCRSWFAEDEEYPKDLYFESPDDVSKVEIFVVTKTSHPELFQENLS